MKGPLSSPGPDLQLSPLKSAGELRGSGGGGAATAVFTVTAVKLLEDRPEREILGTMGCHGWGEGLSGVECLF